MYIYIIIIILFILNILYIKKSNKEYNIYLNNENKKIINALTQARETARQEEMAHKENLERIDGEIFSREKDLKSLEELLQQRKNFNKEIIEKLDEEVEHKKEIIDSTISNYYSTNYKAYRENLEEVIEEIKQDAEEELQNALTINLQEIQKLNNEIRELRNTIDEYRKKRDAINQEILHQREISENKTFYEIQLSNESKNDISYLISIVDHFNNKETIYKIIWTEYIQLPFKNMLNRVLGNKNPKNVIYMIKNEKTNEIYIGKTKAEVSKRWTEHIKTSLNIGTISRTNIHKALFNNWDAFSFSIIEEVPDDINLGDREKFYINFYQSDIYGYNIKSGG